MNNLQVIERENQRVMTTAVLAEEYGTTTDVISKNFNRNKERYAEGKHFYCLEGEALKGFKLTSGQNDDSLLKVNKLYLWTEKGALLHAKSLGTDRAWEVYDILVETYFKKQIDPFEGISTEMKALILQDKKIQAVSVRVDKLETTMTVDYEQQLELERIRKSRAVVILCGMDSNAYKTISGKVFRSIGHDYKEYFKINAYGNTPVARFEEAKQYLKNWQPDNNLQLEINQVNREQIKAS